MKRTILLGVMLSLVAAAGCASDTPTPTPEPTPIAEGLQLASLDEHHAFGTYRIADVAVRFEVVVEDQLESIRFFTPDGAEIYRSELLGNPREVAEQPRDGNKWKMWHYGVLADMSKPMEDQPEVMAWIDSAEAQVVAMIWRDIVDVYPHETGPMNGLFRFGVHLDEALAFDQQGPEDVQEANCACYGKCGPGCFSVGSNWYCTRHDCCCRTYGNWACFSWCFAYPKCPASPC